MAGIKLQRESFRLALNRAQLDPEDVKRLNEIIGNGARTVNVTIDVEKLPRKFLSALLDEPELNANQRAMVSMRVHGVKGNRDEFEEIYSTKVNNAIEFASTFSALGIQSPNCEHFINGRWYPITLGAECKQDELRMFQSVTLRGRVAVGDVHMSLNYDVRPHLFQADDGVAVEKTVRDVLHELGLRPLAVSTIEYNLKLLNAERLSRDCGRSVVVTGPVLIFNAFSWWSRLESRSLGTKQAPRKGVVEPELEACEGDRGYYGVSAEERTATLPFVRIFSLDTKRCVFADVEDVEDYEYDRTAINRLHLPSHMLKILTTVFMAPTDAVFGDLIAGKHGGMVILASGSPGVGKTLTAEVYSELTERPLYVLELGELGTTATDVEDNLNRVFTRVARWDAVLQFDECEIFLSRRNDDLERSAIVGIFLRLLDYYRGILFLTTNRPEVLDEAVISRVTLRLEYPELDANIRQLIWSTMVELANLGNGELDLGTLAQLPLNGRQIRNVVRLAKVVFANGDVSAEEIVELVRQPSSITPPGPELAYSSRFLPSFPARFLGEVVVESSPGDRCRSIGMVGRTCG